MENRSNSKKLLKGTITYAVGDFGTKILSFLIIPLYTFYINTNDMGVYDLLISTMGFLQPIITLQISDAAYRWMISEEEELKRCIKATYDVIFMATCSITVILFGTNFFFTIPYFGYFLILLISSVWYITLIKLVRGLKRQKLYAFIGIIYTVISISLNFIQIVVWEKGVASLFISAIIAYFICNVILLVVEPRLRKFDFFYRDITLIKKFLFFSLPLIPNYLNWWLINSSDSYIVTWVLGTSANGILAISHKFPSVLQTVINLFNTAWQDIVIAEKNRSGEYYTEIFDMMSRVMLGILLVIIPLTKIFIFCVMSEEYKISVNYIPLYYLGAIFQGFSSFYGVGYIRSNKTSKAFTTSLYAAVINFVIDIIAIKFIGMYAASLSTFIGFLVMWLIRERQNRGELGIKVNWRNIVFLTLLDCLVAFISIRTDIFMNVMVLIVGCIIFWILDKKYFIFILCLIKKRIGNT